MEMIPVSSRNLLAVGYDIADSTLYVRFRRGGRTYSYANVPDSVYEALMAASSKGRYFNYRIRYRYQTTRLS